MRVPVLAFRFCGSDSGPNEAAKPSVTRVEVKAERAARKLAKLATFCACGDPVCVQISLPENPTYRPFSGCPTTTWSIGTENSVLGFKPIKTCTDLLRSKSKSLAAARTPVIRRVTDPVEDKVKLTPLKTSVPSPVSVAGEAIGWGPKPLSAVNEIPVS